MVYLIFSSYLSFKHSLYTSGVVTGKNKTKKWIIYNIHLATVLFFSLFSLSFFETVYV